MGGLRYETGRDMPPGMQELAAVKLARELEEAAKAVEAVAQEMKQQCGTKKGMTVGNWIRLMKDEVLTDKLHQIYMMNFERSGKDISIYWCDGKGGCCGADGEELDCDEEKHKACILRWLQSEVAVDA